MQEDSDKNDSDNDNNDNDQPGDKANSDKEDSDSEEPNPDLDFVKTDDEIKKYIEDFEKQAEDADTTSQGK